MTNVPPGINEVIPPRFKQTEGGVIPEDWHLRPIHSFAEVRGRVGWKGYTKSDLVEHGPYAIGAKHIDSSNRLDLSDPTCLSKSKYLESPEIMVRTGDVVIVQRGTIGKLALVNRPIGEATINPSMVIIRTRDVSPDYVTRYLLSHAGQMQILADTSTTGVPMISQKQIGNFLVPLPPTKAEQEAIAEALSDADALIESLEQLLAKKRDLKQATMQQLLTGHQRLPGFHGEWEVKRLGEVVEKLVGGGTPSRSNPAFWGKEVPWVTVKDFATFHPRQTQESITRIGLTKSASHLIPAGTLITSTRMALGKAVIYEVDVAINQDLKAVFLKPNSDVHFLYYWFEHNAQTIDELGSGSTVKGISIAELRGLPFSVPSLPEQTAIAGVLSDMDTEIAALEQRRDKTRALKQGMVQELLTGRTRLV